MTSQTRKNFKEIATICQKLSQKKSKISKKDIGKIFEPAIDILQSSDCEIQPHPIALTTIRLIRNWLNG